MFICHCMRIPESKIVQLSKRFDSVDDVIERTKASLCCGVCENDVLSIFQKTKKEMVTKENGN